jgi:hypothetical protein
MGQWCHSFAGSTIVQSQISLPVMQDTFCLGFDRQACERRDFSNWLILTVLSVNLWLAAGLNASL